ncbi:hypothetical protein D0Z03_002184 [Geotrichum reessii]|nr:hypothetical protein D0Z03_002184 [Galactomyces reessii]
MQFKSILATLATAVTVVLAADNAFTSPAFGQVVNVGDSITLKWNPTTGGKVNLVLRRGGANDLVTLGPIASGIDNTGTYTWKPDSALSTNTDYSVEIQDASNINNVNFTPYFTVLATGEGITSSASTGTAATSTAASSAASDASSDASSESATATSKSEASSQASAASTKASSAASSAAASSHASSAAASSGASSAASHASSHASTLATSAATSSAAATSAAISSTSKSNGAAIVPANAILALGAAAAGAILL